MMEVPTRARPRHLRPILWDEVALGAMTLLYLTTLHPIGVIIAVNGVLCHGSYALSLAIAERMRQWDVAWNVVLGAYANLQVCGQPLCGTLTAFAVVVWRLNQRNDEGWGKSVVHAVCVQLILLVALMHFVQACDPEGVLATHV